MTRQQDAATLLTGRPRDRWPPRLCPDGRAGPAHAVEVHRSPDEVAGENEVAVCGAIVAVHATPWPAPGEACPRCRELTGGAGAAAP